MMCQNTLSGNNMRFSKTDEVFGSSYVSLCAYLLCNIYRSIKKINLETLFFYENFTAQQKTEKAFFKCVLRTIVVLSASLEFFGLHKTIKLVVEIRWKIYFSVDCFVDSATLTAFVR